MKTKAFRRFMKEAGRALRQGRTEDFVYVVSMAHANGDLPIHQQKEVLWLLKHTIPDFDHVRWGVEPWTKRIEDFEEQDRLQRSERQKKARGLFAAASALASGPAVPRK